MLGKGKKSLDSILREKAFKEVEKYLENKDIDINSIEEQDLEALVEAKAKEMESTLKGVAIGGAFVALLESLI